MHGALADKFNWQEPPTEPQGVYRLHPPVYLFTLLLEIELSGEIAQELSEVWSQLYDPILLLSSVLSPP